MSIEEIMDKKEEIENIEEDIKRLEHSLQESKNELKKEQEECNHEILVRFVSKKYVHTTTNQPCPMTYCALCHKHVVSYGNKELEKKTINIVDSIYENLLLDADDSLTCSLILNNYLINKSKYPDLDNIEIVEMINKSIENNEEELTRTLHK
jgi:hypothetical protein